MKTQTHAAAKRSHEFSFYYLLEYSISGNFYDSLLLDLLIAFRTFDTILHNILNQGGGGEARHKATPYSVK